MIMRLAALVAVALIGVSAVSPATAQAREYEAARVEMATKARTCKEAGARIAGAMDCFRTCATRARTLQNSTGLAADDVAKMRAACDAKYNTAQLGKPAAPVKAAGPTIADRAAKMADKAAYCAAAWSQMGCPVDPSVPNAFKRTQMCNVSQSCKRGCGDEGLAARLANGGVSRDVMALDRCETNHGALKDWLGEQAR